MVPQKISTPYDVREVIARLVDGSEFLEFKARCFSDFVGGGLASPWYNIDMAWRNITGEHDALALLLAAQAPCSPSVGRGPSPTRFGRRRNSPRRGE